MKLARLWSFGTPRNGTFVLDFEEKSYTEFALTGIEPGFSWWKASKLPLSQPVPSEHSTMVKIRCFWIFPPIRNDWKKNQKQFRRFHTETIFSVPKDLLLSTIIFSNKLSIAQSTAFLFQIFSSVVTCVTSALLPRPWYNSDKLKFPVLYHFTCTPGRHCLNLWTAIIAHTHTQCRDLVRLSEVCVCV